jgi:hypothetical protein
VYRNDVMEKTYQRWGQYCAAYRERMRTWPGALNVTKLRLQRFWEFYLGPILSLGLLSLPWLWKDRWTALALGTIAVVFVALLAITWSHTHYTAPIAGLVMAVCLQGLRRLRTFRLRQRPCGRMLVSAVPLLWAATWLLSISNLPALRANSWSLERDRIDRDLALGGGRHVVLVRYAESHIADAEWVYNRADIDASAVVWARDLGAPRNDRLLEYFSNRQIWLLEADVSPRKLVRYEDALYGTPRGEPGATAQAETAPDTEHTGEL